MGSSFPRSTTIEVGVASEGYRLSGFDLDLTRAPGHPILAGNYQGAVSAASQTRTSPPGEAQGAATRRSARPSASRSPADATDNPAQPSATSPESMAGPGVSRVCQSVRSVLAHKLVIIPTYLYYLVLHPRPLRDDLLHDLARPPSDREDADVSIGAGDVVLFGKAVAAVELQAFVGDGL